MADALETMTSAQRLLLEGHVQEAHDLLAAELAKPKPEPPPPPPDAPSIVAAPVPDWVSDAPLVAGMLHELLPILEALIYHAGNPPVLEGKLYRLRSLEAGLRRSLRDDG